MNFDILTIFPEYFDVLKSGLIGKAIESHKFSVNVVNIRDFSQDKHLKTDDYPYGGGAGMVMTPDPLVRAIENTTKIILFLAQLLLLQKAKTLFL